MDAKQTVKQIKQMYQSLLKHDHHTTMSFEDYDIKYTLWVESSSTRQQSVDNMLEITIIDEEYHYNLEKYKNIPSVNLFRDFDFAMIEEHIDELKSFIASLEYRRENEDEMEDEIFKSIDALSPYYRAKALDECEQVIHNIVKESL